MQASATPVSADQVLRVCYALTSDGRDAFAAMNLLSAWSVRQYSQCAKIILACDPATDSALRTAGHPLLEVIDEVVPIETPPGEPAFRNRYVKTLLHRFLERPFLYMDADTLVRGSLEVLRKATQGFSAAPNHSGSGHPSEISRREREIFQGLGWPLPTRYYINGGVLWMGTDPVVVQLGDAWHRKWRECHGRTGRHYDQPALNSALEETAAPLKWLPTAFNAQVDVRPATARDAVVWHFYSSNGPLSLRTRFGVQVDRLAAGRRIDRRRVETLCRKPHPWLVRNPIDWWCVRRVLRRFQGLPLTGFDRLWLSGNRGRALGVAWTALRRSVRDRAKSLGQRMRAARNA